ncbi:hypothetical protein MSAN_01696800 [Mycena sanguinolenta]|uniref:T6SS Phospholipase effector Tle1-like catalytic domain-containing protein n=1 Tax=Mycena sanguinolenta TaxID=230812 RepID=A0A8H6Y0T1_9AGAR|nr:hypothetical protein MSAN_01696800 [Mycena sanguinolenta]
MLPAPPLSGQTALSLKLLESSADPILSDSAHAHQPTVSQPLKSSLPDQTGMPSKFADSSAGLVPSHSSDAPQTTGLREMDSSPLSPVQSQTVASSNLPTNPSHPPLNDNQEHPSYPSESPNINSQSPPGQTAPASPSPLPQETPPSSSNVSQTAKGCPCSKSSRRLIVAFDGTEKQFGPRSSHVVEFYSRIVKNDDQPSYYTSGIGTYTKPSGVLKNTWVTVKNKWASIAASNFKSNLLAGYQWLSENYKEGDRIFLLGFSRGAYQARVLAAMITKVGLIRTGNKEQIPFDGRAQPDSETAESGSSDKESKSGAGSRSENYRLSTTAEEFKKAFCYHVNIHFVGVWDTVSSVGIFHNSYFPGAQSADNICFFRHALALDERRVKFLPEYVVAPHLDWFERGNYGEPRCKEVWFRGCHSDVGGGRRMNLTSDNGGVPSRWMAHQAMLAGLEMTPFWRTFEKQDFTGLPPTNSMTWFYKFFEYAPLRISWADDSVPPSANPSLILSPHRARRRQVHPHQKIHLSVRLLGDVDEKSLAHPPSAWGGWNGVLWEEEGSMHQPERVGADLTRNKSTGGIFSAAR